LVKKVRISTAKCDRCGEIIQDHEMFYCIEIKSECPQVGRFFNDNFSWDGAGKTTILDLCDKCNNYFEGKLLPELTTSYNTDDLPAEEFNPIESENRSN